MDMQAKLQTNAQHNLASFTLSGDLDKDGKDTFLFGGENYRDKNKDSNSLFIDIGTRERKRTVYDVNEYFREAMNSGTSSGMKGHAADAAARKKRKGPHMQDFQLYNRERIEELSARERELAQFKEDHLSIMNELRRRAATASPAEKENLKEEIGEMEVMLNQFILSPEEQAEKERLLSEGFADWSRKDFKSFCNALEKHGRYQLPKIIEDVVQETGKDEGDIKRYYVAFWLHYCRLADWNKIIDKIEKGERKIHRLREIRDIIQEKIERHLESVYGTIYPDINNEVLSDSTKELLKQHSPWDLLQYSWSTMQFKYGSGQKTWSYRQEEDAFLMMMMHRHGYGAARRIQLEIRRAWQFRFNWFFKSRSPQEIQKRCDLLIKNVEKELEECHEKEAQEAAEELERKEAELKRMNQELEQSKEAVFGAGVMSTIETNSEQALQSSN
mmetsp:Transcript_18756/g.38900  ORF Transcript_18756/g.38900 Transcript_18756/m.38900 type:complete len:444 (+) Transcript_18756:1-1332(+)